MLSPKIFNKVLSSLFPLLFNIVLRVLDKAIMQEKEILKMQSLGKNK